MTPLPDEIRFVALDGGKVHVVAENAETQDGADVPLRRIGDGPSDPIATLLGLTLMRCGLQVARFAFVGTGRDTGFVARFDDDRLCGGCHRTVHAEEAHRLFEHPQANDAD